MAGKGNAKDILSIINELAEVEPWKDFSQHDVSLWLLAGSGFVAERVELFPKT